MRNNIFSLVLVLLLAACSGLPFNVQPPRITVADIDIQSLGLFEQHFDVNLRVTNPNDFELAIEGLEFELQVNGHPFAKALSKNPAQIPALTSTLMRVDAVTQSIDLLQQFKLVPPETLKAGIPYRIKGRIKIDKVFTWLPFEQNGVYGAPGEKPPKDSVMI